MRGSMHRPLISLSLSLSLSPSSSLSLAALSTPFPVHVRVATSVGLIIAAPLRGHRSTLQWPDHRSTPQWLRTQSLGASGPLPESLGASGRPAGGHAVRRCASRRDPSGQSRQPGSRRCRDLRRRCRRGGSSRADCCDDDSGQDCWPIKSRTVAVTAT